MLEHLSRRFDCKNLATSHLHNLVSQEQDGRHSLPRGGRGGRGGRRGGRGVVHGGRVQGAGGRAVAPGRRRAARTAPHARALAPALDHAALHLLQQPAAR